MAFIKALDAAACSGAPGGSMDSLLSMLAPAQGHGPCTNVWTAGTVAYRCRTCQVTATSAVCVACFKAGGHEGHDYILYRSPAGGCCDCGDLSSWALDGCCPQHRPGQGGHTGPELQDILGPGAAAGLELAMTAAVARLASSIAVCAATPAPEAGTDAAAAVAAAGQELVNMCKWIAKLAASTAIRPLCCAAASAPLSSLPQLAAAAAARMGRPGLGGRVGRGGRVSLDPAVMEALLKETEEAVSKAQALVDGASNLPGLLLGSAGQLSEEALHEATTTLLLLLYDNRFKYCTSVELLGCYQGLLDQVMAVRGGGGAASNAAATMHRRAMCTSLDRLTVQLFNAEDITLRLAQEQQLVEKILVLLSSLINRGVELMGGSAADKSLEGMEEDEDEDAVYDMSTEAFQALFSCYRRVAGDLSTILHQPSVVKYVITTPGLFQNRLLGALKQLHGCLTHTRRPEARGAAPMPRPSVPAAINLEVVAAACVAEMVTSAAAATTPVADALTSGAQTTPHDTASSAEACDAAQQATGILEKAASEALEVACGWSAENLEGMAGQEGGTPYVSGGESRPRSARNPVCGPWELWTRLLEGTQPVCAHLPLHRAAAAFLSALVAKEGTGECGEAHAAVVRVLSALMAPIHQPEQLTQHQHATTAPSGAPRPPIVPTSEPQQSPGTGAGSIPGMPGFFALHSPVTGAASVLPRPFPSGGGVLATLGVSPASRPGGGTRALGETGVPPLLANPEASSDMVPQASEPAGPSTEAAIEAAVVEGAVVEGAVSDGAAEDGAVEEGAVVEGAGGGGVSSTEAPTEAPTGAPTGAPTEADGRHPCGPAPPLLAWQPLLRHISALQCMLAQQGSRLWVRNGDDVLVLESFYHGWREYGANMDNLLQIATLAAAGRTPPQANNLLGGAGDGDGAGEGKLGTPGISCVDNGARALALPPSSPSEGLVAPAPASSSPAAPETSGVPAGVWAPTSDALALVMCEVLAGSGAGTLVQAAGVASPTRPHPSAPGVPFDPTLLHRLNSSDQGPPQLAAISEALRLLVGLLRDRALCGAPAHRRMRAVVVHALAQRGSAGHAQLADLLPSDLGQASLMDEVLDEVATYRAPSMGAGGTYSLVREAWQWFDPYWLQYSRHQLAKASEAAMQTGVYRPHWQLRPPSDPLPPSLDPARRLLGTPQCWRVISCVLLAAVPSTAAARGSTKLAAQGALPPPPLPVMREEVLLPALALAGLAVAYAQEVVGSREDSDGMGSKGGTSSGDPCSPADLDSQWPLHVASVVVAALQGGSAAGWTFAPGFLPAVEALSKLSSTTSSGAGSGPASEVGDCCDYLLGRARAALSACATACGVPLTSQQGGGGGSGHHGQSETCGGGDDEAAKRLALAKARRAEMMARMQAQQKQAAAALAAAGSAGNARGDGNDEDDDKEEEEEGSQSSGSSSDGSSDSNDDTHDLLDDMFVEDDGGHAEGVPGAHSLSSTPARPYSSRARTSASTTTTKSALKLWSSWLHVHGGRCVMCKRRGSVSRGRLCWVAHASVCSTLATAARTNPDLEAFRQRQGQLNAGNIGDGEAAAVETEQTEPAVLFPELELAARGVNRLGWAAGLSGRAGVVAARPVAVTTGGAVAGGAGAGASQPMSIGARRQSYSGARGRQAADLMDESEEEEEEEEEEEAAPARPSLRYRGAFASSAPLPGPSLTSTLGSSRSPRLSLDFPVRGRTVVHGGWEERLACHGPAPSPSVDWQPGLHVHACGHMVHQACFHRYRITLLQRAASRMDFPGRGIVASSGGEVLCPVCRRVANCVLPAARHSTTALPQAVRPGMSVPEVQSDAAGQSVGGGTMALTGLRTLLRQALLGGAPPEGSHAEGRGPAVAAVTCTDLGVSDSGLADAGSVAGAGRGALTTVQHPGETTPEQQQQQQQPGSTGTLGRHSQTHDSDRGETYAQAMSSFVHRLSKEGVTHLQHLERAMDIRTVMATLDAVQAASAAMIDSDGGADGSGGRAQGAPGEQEGRAKLAPGTAGVERSGAAAAATAGAGGSGPPAADTTPAVASPADISDGEWSPWVVCDQAGEVRRLLATEPIAPTLWSALAHALGHFEAVRRPLATSAVLSEAAAAAAALHPHHRPSHPGACMRPSYPGAATLPTNPTSPSAAAAATAAGSNPFSPGQGAGAAGGVVAKQEGPVTGLGSVEAAHWRGLQSLADMCVSSTIDHAATSPGGIPSHPGHTRAAARELACTLAWLVLGSEPAESAEEGTDMEVDGAESLQPRDSVGTYSGSVGSAGAGVATQDPPSWSDLAGLTETAPTHADALLPAAPRSAYASGVPQRPSHTNMAQCMLPWYDGPSTRLKIAAYCKVDDAASARPRRQGPPSRLLAFRPRSWQEAAADPFLLLLELLSLGVKVLGGVAATGAPPGCAGRSAAVAAAAPSPTAAAVAAATTAATSTSTTPSQGVAAATWAAEQGSGGQTFPDPPALSSPADLLVAVLDAVLPVVTSQAAVWATHCLVPFTQLGTATTGSAAAGPDGSTDTLALLSGLLSSMRGTPYVPHPHIQQHQQQEGLPLHANPAVGNALMEVVAAQSLPLLVRCYALHCALRGAEPDTELMRHYTLLAPHPVLLQQHSHHQQQQQQQLGGQGQMRAQEDTGGAGEHQGMEVDGHGVTEPVQEQQGVGPLGASAGVRPAVEDTSPSQAAPSALALADALCARMGARSTHSALEQLWVVQGGGGRSGEHYKAAVQLRLLQWTGHIKWAARVTGISSRTSPAPSADPAPTSSLASAPAAAASADITCTFPRHFLLPVSPTAYLPQLPSLRPLPTMFQDLYLAHCGDQAAACSACGQKRPQHPSLCLVTAKPLCSWWKGCGQEGQGGGLLHAAEACGSTCLLLSMRSSKVIVLQPARLAVAPSPYLDAHGEEDVELRRGRPLYLNPRVYGQLARLWAAGALVFDSTLLQASRTDAEFL